MSIKSFLSKLLIITIPISLFCLEQSNDVSIQLDPSDFLGKSYVKINTLLYEDMWEGKGCIVFNPKFFCRANSSHAFSMAVGYRHQIGDSAVGHHVFVNAKMHEGVLGSTILSQMGCSVDYIHPWWEARVNYYFPNKVRDEFYGSHFNIPHFIESEIVLKSPWFHIAGGPNYSYSSGQLGYTLKLFVPFQRFYCGVCLGNAWTESKHLVTSFGYQFVDFSSSHSRHSKIHYSPTPSYSREFKNSFHQNLEDISRRKDEKHHKVEVDGEIPLDECHMCGQ